MTRTRDGASEADPHARSFSEATVAGLRLRNRLIKAATFEGRTPDGVPGAALRAFHRRIGEGGVAMTTLGYCAAEADGRIDAHMMFMHEAIREPLQALIAEVHATGAAVMGQLVHCGTFTRNPHFQGGRRPQGPSTYFSPIGLTSGRPLSVAMTATQIRERVQVFARAAAFMKSVGFDAIEIHFGHGYAIHQFISPRTNKRTDDYGGTLANRMRFGLEILEAIRTEVGDDYPLFGKISMSDTGRDSFEEAVPIARLLDRGGLDVIVTSGGTSSFDPMFLLRGASIREGIVRQQRSALMRLGIKVAGGLMFNDYPYEELFFLDPARRIREAVQCGVCYVGGASTARSLATLMRDGFDFVQLGRALLYDPDLPRRAAVDRDYENGCTHCNECVPLIDDPAGIRCVEQPHLWSHSD